MAASSSATTVWTGGLADGSRVTTPASGALTPTDMSAAPSANIDISVEATLES